MSDDHLPDVNLIGEMGDVTELGKLVQIVLGCAVSCEKKQGTFSAVEERNPCRYCMQPSVKTTQGINSKSAHMILVKGQSWPEHHKFLH